MFAWIIGCGLIGCGIYTIVDEIRTHNKKSK